MIDTLVKNYLQDKMDDIIRDNLGEQASGVTDVILGALSKNATKEKEATSILDALDKHDEGRISQVDSDESLAILKHIFGDNLNDVMQKTAKQLGIDNISASELFLKIAPIVLGMLGKEKKEKGLDLDDFTNLLGSESKRISESSHVRALLMDFIDGDDDGSVVDDLFAMGKKFLS